MGSRHLAQGLTWKMRCLFLGLIVLFSVAFAEEDGYDDGVDEVEGVEIVDSGIGLDMRAAAAIPSTPEPEKKRKYAHLPPIIEYPPQFEDYPGQELLPPPPPHPYPRPPPPHPHHHRDEEEEAHLRAAAPAYPPVYPPPAPCHPCDLKKFKKCDCVSPPAYDRKGRGNCNVGASKLDLRVWCYVDKQTAKHCPDAKRSKSMAHKGYFWSRIACITA